MITCREEEISRMTNMYDDYFSKTQMAIQQAK
jgi:hypothetical protein